MSLRNGIVMHTHTHTARVLPQPHPSLSQTQIPSWPILPLRTTSMCLWARSKSLTHRPTLIKFLKSEPSKNLLPHPPPTPPILVMPLAVLLEAFTFHDLSQPYSTSKNKDTRILHRRWQSNEKTEGTTPPNL